MKISALAQNVYQTLKRVPRGKITTYKLLGQAVGTKAYRAIGTILSNNPYAPEVPCHRVIASDGSLGGFMGSKSRKNLSKKSELLSSEGIKMKNNKILNYKEYLYDFGA